VATSALSAISFQQALTSSPQYFPTKRVLVQFRDHRNLQGSHVGGHCFYNVKRARNSEANETFPTETPLSYYRARYYDPAAGRFLLEDPVGFQGGDNNVYRYSFNDPVNLQDPTGLTVTCTYNQFSGNLRCTDDSTGKVVVNKNGYSGGNEGKCPACVNNPAAQSVPYSGPIPTGYWSISQCFTWTTAHGTQMSDVSKLTPLLGSSLDAFLRSPGFLIHGGYPTGTTASEGCIIVGKPDREAICQAGGGLLHVISGLPPGVTNPYPHFQPNPGKPKPF
jgi:RHS repeat-associated protein